MAETSLGSDEFSRRGCWGRSLERGLLIGTVPKKYNGVDGETILYTASFEESEDNYVMYQTGQCVLYSLLLVLAWGIGLLICFGQIFEIILF